MRRATNIVWHPGLVTGEERRKLYGQVGATVWLTGLPSSGKSTIAGSLEKALIENGHAAYILDGDNVRHGLNSDLGFSPEEREENIRRIGEVAALFADAGLIAITAFISPYRKDRDKARALHKEGRFLEVFVKCPLDTCEERDPKGLYKKAREGKIPEFTGVSAPYEEPEGAEITIDTSRTGVEEAVRILIDHLFEKGILLDKHN